MIDPLAAGLFAAPLLKLSTGVVTLYELLDCRLDVCIELVLRQNVLKQFHVADRPTEVLFAEIGFAIVTQFLLGEHPLLQHLDHKRQNSAFRLQDQFGAQILQLLTNVGEVLTLGRPGVVSSQCRVVFLQNGQFFVILCCFTGFHILSVDVRTPLGGSL